MISEDARNIWLATIGVIVFGLIALYSATSGNVRVSHSVFYGQLICAVLGLSLMFFLSRVHYRVFFDMAYVFYGLSLSLLLFVIIFGRTALGATRWFTLFGL